MRTLRITIGICISIISIHCYGQQQVGFSFEPGVRRMEIPFERFNNLVVIPVTVNDQLTLKFILDTGVQNTILTNKLYGDVLGLEYDRELIIHGPGENDSIRVLVVDNIDMSVAKIQGKNTPLVILEDDFLKLSNNLGSDVHGIIGYDLFKQFVIQVDFNDNKIIFHDPERFKKKKYFRRSNFYRKIPISIERTKPYMNARINQRDGSKENVKLMIDTGASHAVLLNPASNQKIEVPKEHLRSVLGRGLGGEIYGLVGRIDQIRFDKFEFDDVVSFYPDADHYGYGLRSGDRNGTIGGEILTHFNYVMDYKGKALYLQEGDEFEKTFEFDLSGMEIMSFGTKYDFIMVKYVREGSPASLAGVQRGDIIKSINGKESEGTSLNYVNAVLRSKPGKRIFMRLQRGTENIKVKFVLERMI